MQLLRQGELCVCEIQGALELNQSNTSRHLSRLKEADLVCQEKKGQWIYYALNQATMTSCPFVTAILAQSDGEDAVLMKARAILNGYQLEGNPCSQATGRRN